MHHSVSVNREFLIGSISQIFLKIHGLKKKIQDYFYLVILSDRQCPKCFGRLQMVRDSWCRCVSCGDEFDPTIRFQRCPDCGERIEKKVYHYFCSGCSKQVRSNYCFNERIFNKEYFVKKMQESRERGNDRKEKIKQMLAVSRSSEYMPDSSVNLAAIPGLEEALDEMIGCPFPKELLLKFMNNSEFDMPSYRKHILAHLTPTETLFDAIPSLNTSDLRKDKIWRFITLIFMAHEREVNLCGSNNILVVERK